MVAVNRRAILVAAIVALIIGSIWYGPLFGNAWMKLMKFDPKEVAKMKKA